MNGILSRVASVYLSKAERHRFDLVCEKEGCTPYSLAKKALLDHIWAYPLEKAPPEVGAEISPDLVESDIKDASELEPAIEAEEVSERVRKILAGEIE